MKPSRLDLLDMAINMLNQAKDTQKSLEEISRKSEINGGECFEIQINEKEWARHVYNIVRSGVGILELNTDEIRSLSQKEVCIGCKDDEEEEDE